MKQLLVIAFSLICFIANAQFPITQQQGSPATMLKSRGGSSADSGMVVSASFADTSTANLGFIDGIAGIVIRVGNTLYIRNTAATQWIEIGSGGGGGTVYVDSIYMRAGETTDSLYYTKDGTEYYWGVIDVANGLISGGNVTWTGTGYNFFVSAAVYRINGTRYTSRDTTITLTSSDPTNPRIDVFVVNSSSVATFLTGTAASNPVVPQIDPSTEVQLTSILIPALSTSPTIDTTTVYDENIEWTGSATGVSATFNNTAASTVYRGTYSTDVGTLTNNDYVKYVTGSPINVASKQGLAFFVKLKGAWLSAQNLRVRLYSSGVAIGTEITIPLNKTSAAYQGFTIPMVNFALSSTTVDEVRFRFTGSGSGSGIYLDWVYFQNGITPTPSAEYVESVRRSGDSVQQYINGSWQYAFTLSDKANTSTEFFAGYGLLGGGTLAANRTYRVDTTVIGTKTYIADRLLDKLNISDTSSMLSAYIRYANYPLLKASQTVIADTGRTAVALATGGALTKVADSLSAIISAGDSFYYTIEGLDDTTVLILRSDGIVDTLQFEVTQASGDTAKVHTTPIDGEYVINYQTIPEAATRTSIVLLGSAAVSQSGGELTMTGIGSVATNNIIALPLDHSIEQFTETIQFRANKTTGTQRIGLGSVASNFRNSAGTNKAISWTFDASSGADAGKSYVFTGANGTFTQRDVTAALSFSNGDTIELTVQRDGYTYYLKSKNVTTDDSITLTYAYPVTSTSDPVLPPTSRPAIYQLNQANQVLLSWTFRNDIATRPYLMVIGDSKTSGYNTTTASDRFVSLLQAAHPDSVVCASGYGDEFGDAIKWLHFIKRVAPENLIIALGSNDIRNSVTDANIALNLQAIKQAADMVNCNVYFLGMNENSIIQSYMWTFAQATFGSDHCILTYPTLAGDGVHLTTAGHLIVKNAIDAILF